LGYDLVWFGFEDKSQLNRKIRSMRFGLIRLTFKIKLKPNQTNVIWIRSVGACF